METSSNQAFVVVIDLKSKILIVITPFHYYHYYLVQLVKTVNDPLGSMSFPCSSNLLHCLISTNVFVDGSALFYQNACLNQICFNSFTNEARKKIINIYSLLALVLKTEQQIIACQFKDYLLPSQSYVPQFIQGLKWYIW